MERRTYRGPITARGLAGALIQRFTDGNFIAQATGEDAHLVVQIVDREVGFFGKSRSALTVSIVQSSEAVDVAVGEHQWLGPAADLLGAGFKASLNPFTILRDISEIADDFQALQLPALVWQAVDHYVESVGARLGLASEMQMVACPFCGLGNPVGAARCPACGGSLVAAQPKACPKCGKVAEAGANFCDRCGAQLT